MREEVCEERCAALVRDPWSRRGPMVLRLRHVELCSAQVKRSNRTATSSLNSPPSNRPTRGEACDARLASPPRPTPRPLRPEGPRPTGSPRQGAVYAQRNLRLIRVNASKHAGYRGLPGAEVNKYYMLPAVRLVDRRVQRRSCRGARVPQTRKMSGEARRAVVEDPDRVRALHRTADII